MITRTDGTLAAAASVVEHLRSLARLEQELAIAEVRRKATLTAGGIGAALAAALLSFFVVGVGVAVIVALLALVLDVWLALLVVLVLLVAVTGGLGLLARSLLARRGPPLPEQALTEARRIGEILGMSDGR